MRTVLALLLLVCVAPPASAELLHNRSIPYFEQHTPERIKTLRACRADFALAKQAVCQNAEQADFAAYAKRKEREVWGHGR